MLMAPTREDRCERVRMLAMQIFRMQQNQIHVNGVLGSICVNEL